MKFTFYTFLFVPVDSLYISFDLLSPGFAVTKFKDNKSAEKDVNKFIIIKGKTVSLFLICVNVV